MPIPTLVFAKLGLHLASWNLTHARWLILRAFKFEFPFQTMMEAPQHKFSPLKTQNIKHFLEDLNLTESFAASLTPPPFLDNVQNFVFLFDGFPYDYAQLN